MDTVNIRTNIYSSSNRFQNIGSLKRVMPSV